MENYSYKLSRYTEYYYAKLHGMPQYEIEKLKSQLSNNLNAMFNDAGDLSYLDNGSNEPNDKFLVLNDYLIDNSSLIAALSLYDLDFYKENKVRFFRNAKYLTGIDSAFVAIAGHLANTWTNCLPQRELNDYFSDEFLKSKQGLAQLTELFVSGNNDKTLEYTVKLIRELKDEYFLSIFDNLYQNPGCGLHFLDIMNLKDFERFLKLASNKDGELDAKKLEKNENYLKVNTEHHVKSDLKKHGENGVDSYGLHLLKSVFIATKNEIFTKIEQAVESLKYEKSLESI